MKRFLVNQNVLNHVVRPNCFSISRTTMMKTCMSRHFSTEIMEMNMPALSPTMTTGTVVSWKKKEGDVLSPGEILCEVETDKAVVDYEIQDDAVLAKILVPAGTKDVDVGSLLAYTVEDEEAYAEILANGLPESLNKPAPVEGSSTNDPSVAVDTPPATAETTGRVPLIRFLGKRSLLEKAVPVPVVNTTKDTSELTAKVPETTMDVVSGVVSSGDVSSGEYDDIELTNMRKIIAKRLVESKVQVPHFYLSIDCEIDEIMSLRKKLKSEHRVNVSLNDFLLKSVACALRDVPEANHSFNPSTGIPEKNSSVDVSVAVATDNGLITPIVPSVDKKGLSEINGAFKDLVTRARANKLKLDEFQGGSFTISNLGGFGIDKFTAIMNPPQSCIMAVGRGRKEVVLPVGDVDFKSNPEPRVATLMNSTISADRRVLDDAIAGQFLQAFKKYMENPNLLML